MFNIDLEQVLTVVSLGGATVAVVVFLWRTFIALRKFIATQEEIQTCIADIKCEVTYNSGGSIKDMVLKLSRTCNRMEVRQRVIDQRSKAALHFQNKCLFEIDNKGHMVWANESFYQKTVDRGDISEGLDWITVINEDERENFVTELDSCLEMGRLLDIETVSTEGEKLHFIGHPYRVGEGHHEGFLIHIQTLEN